MWFASIAVPPMPEGRPIGSQPGIGIKIRRKGGYEAIVYFGDEVEQALREYLTTRHAIIPAEGHENALFLSIQNRRISVRAVENLVKKYAQTVTTLKKITPHKLRSTFGTNLYHETGDIYLVADVLGHSSIETITDSPFTPIVE